MLRKSLFALTAAAATAAAALTPTSALAWHSHHRHWHGGGGYGWVAPAIIAGTIATGAVIAAEQSCYRRVWVRTPHGPRRVLVNVC
jgi:hypothetical protein